MIAVQRGRTEPAGPRAIAARKGVLAVAWAVALVAAGRGRLTGCYSPAF